MTLRPLYIFDLDGTLADISHRKHLLDAEDSQKWRRFYARCDKDTPNAPVVATMHALRLVVDVWIFSGRSSEVRDKTEAWLAEHTTFMRHELTTALVMRDEGDYTPDDDLKRGWYRGMLAEDRGRLVAVFDDRDRVVQMWRSEGVTCFQVANGDF